MLVLWSLICLVSTRCFAQKLVFSHGGATWTLEVVEGAYLHVQADCDDQGWCALGFNSKKPRMEGTDIFTFGHHPGVDLYECNISANNTCGNCSACGACQASARRRALGSSGRRRAPGAVSDPSRRRTNTVPSDPARRRTPPVVAAPSRRRAPPVRRRTSPPSSPVVNGTDGNSSTCEVCGASDRRRGGVSDDFGARRRGRRLSSDSSSGTLHRMHQQHVNPYFPRLHRVEFWLPEKPRGQNPETLDTVDGVVGVALNSALLVHEHPGEGMTWLLDNCGGHGDQFGHYHYHAPPLCLLRELGVPVPSGSWWKDMGPDAWPLDGPDVQIGWAMDGARIMSPYIAGKRVDLAVLDACHGATDPGTGEYRFTDALTERLADAGFLATAGAPFGWPFDQRMLSRNLEACPCGGAEGNVDTHVITIDGQQDLENVSYAVENGRMKASAVRPLSTGDGTDLELVPDSLYYLIMTVGSTKCGVNQYVSYHNPSALQTHVCLMTLSATFECKPAADWPDTPPALSTTGSSTSTSTSSSFTVTSSSGTKTAISTTTSTTAWEWEGGPSLSLSNGVQEAKPCMLALTGIFLFFEQCL